MSEWQIQVVRIGPVEKHPNADRLGVTMIHGGYPVIVGLNDYSEGDLAVYVPVDSIVPNEERWSFLEKPRIRAKKIRGVFSMGLLTHVDPSWQEGQDVAKELGITKYDESIEHAARHPLLPGEDATAPGEVPFYTDIENIRKWRDVFLANEEVVITEKIHGENCRVVWKDGQLHVGSHRRWKKRETGGRWWQAVLAAGIEERLSAYPDLVLFGESHGYTGGFPYGTQGPALRVFDILLGQRYVDYHELESYSKSLDLTLVPTLYRGPYSWDIVERLAEGSSTLDPSHIREGVVIRPVKESYHYSLGRVILKLHGQGFLLRK